MDKKKFFKIGGIVFLSILGLFITAIAGIAILKNFVGARPSYELGMADEISYMDNNFKSTSSFDGLLANSFSSKSAGDSVSREEAAIPVAPTTEPIDTSQKDKNIIKRGNLSIYADNIDDTIEDIDTIAKKYQAESQNTYDNGKGINRRVNIEHKVKVNDFENFFNELKDMDVEIGSASSGITDVTNEVIDLQARLKTYRNTEAQLLEIQKTAKKVAD